MVIAFTTKEGLSIPEGSGVSTYAGKSASERSAQRRAALLDAALDVIAESGPAALTVRGVCRRVHLNDRYFYEHFAHCDELIGALYDDLVQGEYLTEVVKRMALAGNDLAAQARAAAEVTIGLLERDTRHKRLLAQSSATPALRARRDDLIRLVAGVMQTGATQLFAKRGTMVDMQSIVLAAGILEALTLWARGELLASAADMVDGIALTLVTGGQGLDPGPPIQS